MPSTSRSTRNFQTERLDQRVDEIVDQLKEQRVKIEEMLSRLQTCLVAVETVEQSVGARFSVESIDQMRSALAAARAALIHTFEQLERTGARLS